jgi:heme/copper-type cytochrome/quinol oxidase subunit 1
MEYFLYTIIILFGLSVLGKVTWIANDDFPERKRKTEVWDVLITSMLIVWAISLLTA